jgi:hypothetical protein
MLNCWSFCAAVAIHDVCSCRLLKNSFEASSGSVCDDASAPIAWYFMSAGTHNFPSRETVRIPARDSASAARPCDSGVLHPSSGSSAGLPAYCAARKSVISAMTQSVPISSLSFGPSAPSCFWITLSARRSHSMPASCQESLQRTPRAAPAAAKPVPSPRYFGTPAPRP